MYLACKSKCGPSCAAKADPNMTFAADVRELLDFAEKIGQKIAIENLFNQHGIRRPDTKTINKFPVVYLATFFGHKILVQMLLQQGANINKQPENNLGLLDLAKALGNQSMVDLLQLHKRS